MTADTLRRAASLMRDRAEAATQDATLDRYDHGGGRLAVFEGTDRHLVADLYGDGADREHIASWTPAVALAVADSLDQAAAVIEEAASGPLQMAMNAIAEPLVVVARTYLGDDS